MFPLGALIAGDPAGAYQQSQKRQQDIDLGDIQQQGMGAAARFMQSMVPGASAMPQASQPQNPIAALVQRFRALGAPSQPPMQMGAPAPSGGAPPMPYGFSSPMGPSPPMGGPPGGPGAAAPPPAPGAGAPPASMGQSAAGPRLSLQQVIEGVVRSNPGIKDPRVLFAAVSQMAPLLRTEDQAQFREMQLAMREQLATMQDATRRAGQQEKGREFDVSTALKEKLAGMSDSTKRELFKEGIISKEDMEAKKEAGKTERAEKTEAGKKERFEKKEERLSRESMLRQDRSMQELEVKKRALAQRITKQGDRSMLAQWRAIVDAQHKKATEIIAASPTGMDDAERKKLLAEEDKFYREEIEKMRTPKQQQAPADGGWKVEKVQ
jgi:hypothetical protein